MNQLHYRMWKLLLEHWLQTAGGIKATNQRLWYFKDLYISAVCTQTTFANDCFEIIDQKLLSFQKYSCSEIMARVVRA